MPDSLSHCSRHRRYAHALTELWLDFIQEFPLPILYGDSRNGHRPGQAETMIAVAKASFSAGCVELTDLIAGIGVVSKGLIAVREPFRHVQRAVVVLGELHRDMLQVSGAFRAKVDDDVDDRTTRAANQLALGCGWTLEVHSSQRPLLPVGCNVGLCNRRFQPVVGEFLLTEGAREKPPAVLVWSEVDEKRPVQPGFGKDHHASRCRPAIAARPCR